MQELEQWTPLAILEWIAVITVGLSALAFLSLVFLILFLLLRDAYRSVKEE